MITREKENQKGQGTVYFVWPLLVALIVIGSGCSGSGSVANNSDDVRVAEPDPTKFEDFDESQYQDGPAMIAVELVHDVPADLMASRAADGAKSVRRVQGFRIQIHDSLDKDPALRKEDWAREWWKHLPPEEKPSGMFGSELPVYLKYVQPYYRVRIGDFESRGDADVALAYLQGTFPEAFIAIDTIVVVR